VISNSADKIPFPKRRKKIAITTPSAMPNIKAASFLPLFDHSEIGLLIKLYNT
jgi:hypothetical protein